MLRLFNGLRNICLLAIVFVAFLSVIGSISWMILNTEWLNLLWVIPVFIGMCWIMGDDV